MLVHCFPLIFVLLWSSAFVSTRFIVEESTPFAALCFRFAVVAAAYALFAALYQRQPLRAPLGEAAKAMAIGALFHGFYLGGVFYAIARGMPAGLAALIVSLQPFLTAALARPLLGEKITRRQWGGMALGFGGAGLVLGVETAAAPLPLAAWAAILTALLAMTAGTLWQKKISHRLPLSVNSLYQAASAALFHAAAFMLLEDSPHINFTPQFMLSMGWQIVFVSLGAFTILMYLISRGDASKTAALFFLVPGVSAAMAWLALDEAMSAAGIAGLLASSAGVYIAVRAKSG